MQPSALAKRVYISLFAILIVFYLYGLGQLPLVGPDEPRYAQVAREMFLRGDFITPTLGGHTWFEKPALLYWMMMVAFKLFGVSEWSARLGPAVCGLLVVLAIWLLTRQVERKANLKDSGLCFWSTVVCGSSLGLIVFSRAASFDIVITMTTCWALALFFVQEIAETNRQKRWSLIGFYVFVGLSLLAKGLVGPVIVFGVIGTYFLLRRQMPPRQLLTSAIWGIPLLVAVAAIWYGPVIAIHRWSFIQEFFIEHHFARYVSNKYHHPQPIYFYPIILLLLSLPWTAYLVDSVSTVRRWRWQKEENAIPDLRIFAFAWVLLPVVFFSFSGSKLPGYLLPVLPAAAVLSGSAIALFGGERKSRWPSLVTGILCLTLALGGIIFAWRSGAVGLRCVAFAAGPLFVAGVGAILWAHVRREVLLGIALAIFVMVVVALNCAAPSLTRRESVRDLLLLADSRGYGNLPVLAQPGDDRTAEFYASGRVIYRSDGEPLTIDEVNDHDARQLGPILVFVKDEHLAHFSYREGMELIGNNGHMALLVWNPPVTSGDGGRKTR